MKENIESDLNNENCEIVLPQESVILDLAKIQSAVLNRLVKEVAYEKENEINSYNRLHNRHNRHR